MGSNYFGERPVGLSSSSSSSQSSSRKGKKNGSDKSKQPQRGLGVAQLEKIRLHSQLGCNYLPSVPNPYHAPNFSQEDIRLQTAYPTPSSSSFAYSSSSAPYGVQGPHGVMMGFQDLDRASVRYGDVSQSTNVARWHPHENALIGSQQIGEPNMTRSFFESGDEASLKQRQDRHEYSRGMSTQNSESSNSQEIDLELRLSL